MKLSEYGVVNISIIQLNANIREIKLFASFNRRNLILHMLKHLQNILKTQNYRKSEIKRWVSCFKTVFNRL